MKESIYMIPLTDAFSQTETCPFCYIKNKLETDMVEYCVGPSMMEPDSREKSNHIGFCEKHLDMMLRANKRLSLALMLSTHLDNIKKIINETDILPQKGGLFKKAQEPDFSMLTDSTSSCVICEKIDGDVKRYTGTFFYMWEKKPNFRELPGFSHICLQHGAELLAKTPDSCSSLREVILNTLKEAVSAKNKELRAFIDMFDYRTAPAAPDAHKSALPDAIEFLRYK